MSFTKYGLIQALDYNTLTGDVSSTSANTFNTIWATGTGNSGYGQTALNEVAEGQEVTASDWANLNNGINNIAKHQGRATGNGFSINNVYSPSLGSTVDYGYKTFLQLYGTDQSSSWNITPVNSYGTVYPPLPTVFRFDVTPNQTPFTVGKRIRISNFLGNPNNYVEGYITNIGTFLTVAIDFSTFGLLNFNTGINGIYVLSSNTTIFSTTLTMTAGYDNDIGNDPSYPIIGFVRNYSYYPDIGTITPNTVGSGIVYQCYDELYDGNFWFALGGEFAKDYLVSISVPSLGKTFYVDNTTTFYPAPSIDSDVQPTTIWVFENFYPNTIFGFVDGQTYDIVVQFNNSSDISALPTNLQMVYNNKLNSIGGSTSFYTNTRRPTSWNSSLTFTHTATFANANAARYFFNSGGQLKINCSHPTNPPTPDENTVFHDLASNIGTISLSSPTSGFAIIGGDYFNGVTKTGGGGNNPTISTNSGFYALTTANTTLFTQSSTSQTGSTISIIGKVNDVSNPSVVTLYTVWTQVPSGNTVSSGSGTGLGVCYPETTYIANTWGTVTVVGSVTGS
jgi:hypothetical protein